MNIFFSVVIPAFNSEKHIERAIDSILCQTYIGFEIIVVDDGSTDNTYGLAARYKSKKIKVLKQNKNLGVHEARNFGKKHAQGNYVVFLDSDDELLPDCLCTLFGYIENSKYPTLVLSPYRTNQGELTCFEQSSAGFVSYENFLCHKNFRRLRPGLAAVRKDLAAKYSFVAPNVDFIFFRYVIKEGDVYYIPNPLAIYHLEDTPGALHVSRKKLSIERSVVRARALHNFLKDFKDDYIKYCPDRLGSYSYGTSVGLLLDGKYRDARSRARDAMFYSDYRLKYLLFYFFSLCPFSSKILNLSFRCISLAYNVKV